MTPIRLRLVPVLALGLLAPSARAQTSYPMLARVQPTAIQRGQTVEVSLGGTQNFAGANALLFEGTGLSAEVLDAPKPADPPPAQKRGRRGSAAAVKAKITVAADAALGPRELRVVTPQGVSSVGLIVITADPVVTEADDKANDLPATAQAVTLPAVLTGTIGKNEDVDWYSFRADAGQRVTFRVWGNRLEDKIHDLQTHLDPILQLFDDAGRELAADDNSQFADPRLVYEFKQAGTYRIQVRDTTYAGNANWTYVLHASAGPDATSVFPMAVRAGASAELRASGVNIDPAQPITLAVPADARPGPLALPLPTASGETPPVPLVVTDLPLATEADDAPAEPASAQPASLPVALSGRLGTANDVDAFKFETKKGTAHVFEVMARRVGSAADPVLRVLDAKGKTLAEADDTYGKDPRLEWTAPADGTFAIDVRDLHSRGGEGFGYVLLARQARPDFALSCDPDKLNVGPGARTSMFVKVVREGGFQGPVAVTCAGLPPGMSASPLTVPEGMTQGEIVVSAAADAPQGAALFTVHGQAETPDGPITRLATPRQEIYLPGGGRGLYDVETLAAAVTEPSDITVEAKPDTITLTPGQTATIDVTVKRLEGFEGPVNLAIDLAHLGRSFASPLPPGVTLKPAGSKTLLGPKDTAGKIILEAKADAPPCDGVPIAIMGHVSINFVVKTAFSSAPITLSVAPKGK